MKKTIILTICSLALFSFQDEVRAQKYSEGDVLGIWLNHDRDGHIKIYKKGNTFEGKLIWMVHPIDSLTGKPKLDKNNPDKALRDRPLDGLVLIKDFKFDADDDEWEDGKIYDPKNGKTYSCEMELESMDTLEVTGYIGFSFIGRTVIWTRLKTSPGLKKYPDK